jgi:hypothetical protein
MSLTVVDVVTYIAVGCIAASRLFSAVQPLWAKLPKWLAVALPVLVLSLPQVAGAAGLVHTNVDLVQFVITAVALLVPGLAAAEEARALAPKA